MRTASLYFAIVLLWSLAIRFESALLIASPALVRLFAAITVALAMEAVRKEWRPPISTAIGRLAPAAFPDLRSRHVATSMPLEASSLTTIHSAQIREGEGSA
jgi:hypothetical protein